MMCGPHLQGQLAEGSYYTVLAGLESQAATRKAAACYRAFRTGSEVFVRLCQPMLLREADYLHPRLRSVKPIFIMVPYHIGKKRMYFFPLIPSTDKLVKRVRGIVPSMWVNMPEEEAVGRNSIFIHLMKGLPSFFSHELQILSKFSCIFLLSFRISRPI